MLPGLTAHLGSSETFNLKQSFSGNEARFLLAMNTAIGKDHTSEPQHQTATSILNSHDFGPWENSMLQSKRH